MQQLSNHPCRKCGNRRRRGGRAKTLSYGKKHNAARDKGDQQEVDSVIHDLQKVPVAGKEILEEPEWRANYPQKILKEMSEHDDNDTVRDE